MGDETVSPASVILMVVPSPAVIKHTTVDKIMTTEVYNIEHTFVLATATLLTRALKCKTLGVSTIPLLVYKRQCNLVRAP